MLAVFERSFVPTRRIPAAAACCLLTAVLACPPLARAQKEAPITLNNASFEDIPESGKTPQGWYNCGPTAESPPDVQPGQFSVTKTPKTGNTYLGLVVRDNDTWESVAQRLSRPLEQGKCYEWSIDLCRSEVYLSASRLTNSPANYTQAAKLIIYGGNGFCQRLEKLDESPLVYNSTWQTYTFRLKPQRGTYSHIVVEAYYKTPILVPYNGHILLDNASAIRRIPCDQPVAAVAKKQPPPRVPAKRNNPATADRTTAKGPARAADTPATTRTAAPTPSGPMKIGNKTVVKGEIVRLEKVYFDANQYAIKDSSVEALNELYQFMKRNPRVTIEVRGHTNNRATEQFALELSTNRAKAVAEWLMNRGISPGRIQYKGYGWTQPVLPNTTEEGRRKNQRVEVKIVNISG